MGIIYVFYFQAMVWENEIKYWWYICLSDSCVQRHVGTGSFHEQILRIYFHNPLPYVNLCFPNQFQSPRKACLTVFCSILNVPSLFSLTICSSSSHSLQRLWNIKAILHLFPTITFPISNCKTTFNQRDSRQYELKTHEQSIGLLRIPKQNQQKKSYTPTSP